MLLPIPCDGMFSPLLLPTYPSRGYVFSASPSLSISDSNPTLFPTNCYESQTRLGYFILLFSFANFFLFFFFPLLNSPHQTTCDQITLDLTLRHLVSPLRFIRTQHRPNPKTTHPHQSNPYQPLPWSSSSSTSTSNPKPSRLHTFPNPRHLPPKSNTTKSALTQAPPLQTLTLAAAPSISNPSRSSPMLVISIA